MHEDMRTNANSLDFGAINPTLKEGNSLWIFFEGFSTRARAASRKACGIITGDPLKHRRRRPEDALSFRARPVKKHIQAASFVRAVGAALFQWLNRRILDVVPPRIGMCRGRAR
jgi:hypothetical protein